MFDLLGDDFDLGALRLGSRLLQSRQLVTDQERMDSINGGQQPLQRCGHGDSVAVRPWMESLEPPG